MTFCCEMMEKNSLALKDESGEGHSIIYDLVHRNYRIYFLEEPIEDDRIMMDYIDYCPWCGTKLPSSLSEEWWDILEKEYGITDPSEDDRDRVPPEFRTDQWWKKRGL